MEFLTSLLESSTTPWLSAFILGLMTAISPCPLATNITAIAYIGKEIENRRRVFLNGLLYTFGRAVTYTILALIIYAGANQLKFSGFFQKNGEKFLGPLLILIGLFMLNPFKIRLPEFARFSPLFQKKVRWNRLDAIFLGIIFALAFCPYSGILYFGMLIPMTISSASGLYLPVVFAVGTGVPVIIIAWILAYSVSGIGNAYNKIKVFELWFRRVIAVLFIAAGAYYTIRACFPVS